MSGRRFRRARGFTMIEVLAAVLLTSIVISVAVAFQINLGSSMKLSRERLRTERQAVALLDRISRDLMGAYFIQPKEGAAQSPQRPWIFLTAREYAAEEAPSDRLKFITRNYQSQGLDEHSSDLATIAYFLYPMEDLPAYELLRWRSTRLPVGYDPTFPAIDDPDTLVMGEGIASFGFTMVDHAGGEVTEWDSLRAGARQGLPFGVRIEIAMQDPEVLEEARYNDFDGAEFDAEFEVELGEEPEESGLKTFSKLVVLPLRPLDWSFLEAEVDAAAGGVAEEDLDGDGIPDSEDDDIDGDGILNEDDDDLDADGAGIEDFGDDDPFGFGDDDEDEDEEEFDDDFFS